MKAISNRFKLNSKKLFIYIISTFAMFLVVGGLTYQATKAQVTVLQDNEVIMVETHNETVGELLEDLEIKVEAYDELSHERNAELNSGMKIHITKANHVVLDIDGKETEYATTAETVKEFLEEKNIEINEFDAFSHSGTDLITEGLVMEITRAYPISITDADKEWKVWTTGETVGKLLKDEGIDLREWDQVTPSKQTSVQKDTIVTITRVEIITETSKEKQKYKTITKEDHTLEKGKTKILSEGEDGILARHYEVRKENGKEVERRLLKEKMEKQAIQKVVAVGTKMKETEPAPVDNPVAIHASSSSVPDSQTKGSGKSSNQVMYMHATAYTAECNGCSGKTATGIDLKQNPDMKVIAVDPSVIPLGTKVWVEGYGTAIAGDTGGAIKGNQIDIHVPSKESAINFGSKQVQVKILN